MWFRDKVALVLTTIIITVQITTSHCVPSVLRKDALNFETRGNKIGNANNARNYQNTLPKSSLFQTYNFPETEFPHESSPRDPLYSGRNLNTNPFNTKGVSSSKSKACNDLKKDMRMKRKLDRIHEIHKTNVPYFSSDPVTNKLIDTDMFPEVKYPLNAMDTWEPHYWNPSIVSPKEEQYVPPDFPIFNPKTSDSKKTSKPYKKQFKSKTKQFMEDIDMFNEKMRSSRSQSNKTMVDTYTNNSESFKQPESNDINVLRMDVEAISNKTTEVNQDAITYQCLLNTSTTESRELNNLSRLSQVNSTITKSPLFLTSKEECNSLDVTPIPIPYKVLEKNNFNSNFESNNVKDLDMNPLTDENNDYVSNGPPFYQTDDVLDEDVRRIILNTTNRSQQQPEKIANTTDHRVCAPVQNNNTIVTIPNDDPLNVKIPFPVYDKMPTTGFIKKTTQLSRSNTNERPLANIIVIPISNSVNNKQIQIVDSNTGSPIVVFLPTTETDTKPTITADDAVHDIPLITETVSNNAFSNRSKTSDVHEPLQIHMTDLPDIISEMMEIPTTNFLDIPCTTVSDSKLSSPDFELLPNDSMCHVSPNEVNVTNMITEPYNATESFNGILSVTEIPCSVENFQNYTYLELSKNNTSELNIDSIDTVDTTSLPEVEPTAYVHGDTGKTAELLVVRKLIDLLLKDLVQKDPYILVDKILPKKSIRVKNVEMLPVSKDIEFKDTIMPNDMNYNVTIYVNVLPQSQSTEITQDIPALRPNENSSLSEDITDNIFLPLSTNHSDKFIDTPLTFGNIESFESLPKSKEYSDSGGNDSEDTQFTDTVEDNKSLPLYMKVPDSLLTDKAFLTASLTSNDTKHNVLSVYETLMDSYPSDTAGGDMDFLLSMTDRFVNSNDNESLNSLDSPGYDVLQDTSLNVSKGDDISLPMPIKPFDGNLLVFSDNKSLHSLPDYKELIDVTLSDNIGNDIPIYTSSELSNSLLTDAVFLDISSKSNSDSKEIDKSLPLSEKLSDVVVNSTLTSDGIESLELLTNYVSSSMKLPETLLTYEAVNDSALIISNHSQSVELIIPVNEVLIDTLLNDTLANDVSLPLSTKLPDRRIDTPLWYGGLLVFSDDKSLHSLPDYKELVDVTLSDNIGDDIALSTSRELSDSLLTDAVFVDISSSSNSDSKGIDMSLPLSEKLSDGVVNSTLTTDGIESLELLPDYVSSSMELPDTLVTNEAFNDSALIISNHNKSVKLIPVNKLLIDTLVNDTLVNDISLPLSRKLPNRLIDTPLTTSKIGSLESLPDYEELTGTLFSDSIEDDSSLSLSMEPPYSLKAFLDASSRNSDSLEVLPIYEILTDTPLDDDVSLLWSMEVPGRFVDTPLTSDIESLESFTGDEEPVDTPLTGDMENDVSLPWSMEVSDRFVDISLTSDIKSLESLTDDEEPVGTPLSGDIENDVSLPWSMEVPDRFVDIPLTSDIKTLESLTYDKEPVGTPLSGDMENDMSLPWSMEVPDRFVDIPLTSDIESLESLRDDEEPVGTPLSGDMENYVSLPWSMEVSDRFVDIPLTSDIKTFELLTDDEEQVGTPPSSDIEYDMSLPKEPPDSLLVEDNEFNDTSLVSNANKNLQSLQGNRALSTNPLNDNWDDMLPIQLPENNDETIQKPHSTDILHEGVFMDTTEPSIITENNQRLLARNTLPYYWKEDKVLPAYKVTNDLDKSQISVNKHSAKIKLIANDIPQSEAVKELIKKLLSEVSADDKPMYVDETLTDSRSLDDSPLQINRLSEIILTPKTKVISGDVTSSINKKVPIFMDEQLSSSEVLYTSIVKYLYDAV